MKKLLSIAFISILFFNCYSQIEFEEGYFIGNDGQKINCLIKNKDWRYNPTAFEYKFTQNEISKIVIIDSVMEFATPSAKYYRYSVDIDRSSELSHNLSTTRHPIFKKETLFLKVLVEGKANLFSYEDTHLTRFFYESDSSTIQQLIFKSYKVILEEIQSGRRHEMAQENNGYKQQLLKLNNFKCENITPESVARLNYRKKDLVAFFEVYNDCINPERSRPEAVQEDLFNLTARIGRVNSSLSINNDLSGTRDVDFGNSSGFRIGIEAESILPFRKKTWSIFIEPSYQSFTARKTITYIRTSVLSRQTEVTANYKSIEFPVGTRYYLFLNSDSKLFLNAVLVFNNPIESSSVTAERKDILDLVIRTRPNFAFGFGYNFKDKLFVEMRRGFRRTILSDHKYWNSSYKTFSFIIGYSLF